jgi:hypothetical protein
MRPDQYRAALGPPMRSCADEVDAMIAAHDQVYYCSPREFIAQSTQDALAGLSWAATLIYLGCI